MPGRKPSASPRNRHAISNIPWQRRQRLAEERIAQAEAKAAAEIRAVAVDVAIAAAREVIAAQLDEGRGGALIDSAIAALPQRLR